jgi:multiple sugar transport system permease protein
MRLINMPPNEIKTKNTIANFHFPRFYIEKYGFFWDKIWSSRYSYLYIAPFMVSFLLFILIPVLASIRLSFTYFNAFESPRFIGWDNFQYILSQDLIFLKHSLPNTIKFALITGPGGFIAAYILAWLIAQLPNGIRLWFVLAYFAPSLTAGIAMNIIWIPLLTGDRIGYLNNFLLRVGIIQEPQLWLLDQKYLMIFMVIVTLWTSMGIGFLAMLAGILNVDPVLYEAARIDGMKSKLQEIWYITIPMMKQQMLFAAVMAIVGSFKMGHIGVELSGMNPTPQYAGNLLTNHVEDYGLLRFELGYASAVAVVLLLIIYSANKLSWKLFGNKEGD